MHRIYRLTLRIKWFSNKQKFIVSETRQLLLMMACKVNTARYIIMLILLCNAGFIQAQGQGDHLEPVESIYDIYDFQFEYYSKVREILFNGLTDSPVIRFQVMPSFTPENVLDIEFDRENDKYYIVYHICNQSIWYNEKWKKIKVNKSKTEIDKESVELIKSLFDLAISQTTFPEEENMGLDGVYYYFSIYKWGLKSGTIWSPTDETKMDKLVNIGYDLVKLAQTKEDLVKFDSDFQVKIESLINELKE